jgi:UDP:flavonoid glycosyltransferase YjiC (YdhE family)
VQALRRTKQRGLLASGWGGLSQADLPKDVFVVESIPHDWVFPQVAAVVHHGGAGTTSAGLRSGVPSVIVPFFVDQPFWGQRVFELGVGPPPIPYGQLSTERLAEAIDVAVNDRGMHARAAALGARIRAEDGVARAVEAISRLLERRADRHPGVRPS